MNDKKREELQETERVQFNADAVKRVRQAVEIAIHIMSPAWNQQAAVALANRILDETSGSLDGEVEKTRGEWLAQASATRTAAAGGGF